MVDFAIPINHRVKIKENKKRKKYLELKKLWNMKVMVIPIIIGALWMVPKGFIKGMEELEIRVHAENIPNYSIVKISKNTGKSPGDIRRVVVTQTLVKYHQLTLVWKLARNNNNNNNKNNSSYNDQNCVVIESDRNKMK